VDPGTRSVLSLARSVPGELEVDVVLERVLGASRDLTAAKWRGDVTHDLLLERRCFD